MDTAMMSKMKHRGEKIRRLRRMYVEEEIVAESLARNVVRSSRRRERA
jgi:hypothetical protein